jgi:hypothetical protein
MSRAPRPCLVSGCPLLTTTGPRCPTHTRQKDQARGTRQQRGYDATHDQARRALIATLPHYCAYGCGRTLTHPNELVAAHRVDGHPEHGWIPSCQQCNRAAMHPH